MTKTRDDVQSECFDHWLANDCRTIVNIATGTGKSYIMINAIEFALNNSNLPALILAHSEESRDITLPNEFKKFNKETLLERCIIVCYNSLSKYIGDYCIGAFDEAHYLTENNSVGLNKSYIERYIFLTATLPEEKEKLKILWKYAKANYYLHVDEAIKNNILNDYKIFIKYIDLNDKNINVKLYKSKPATTEEKAYKDLTKKIEYFQNTGQYNNAEMTRLKRMHFIYNLDSKYIVALDLKKLFKNKRYIIFAASTKMADKLSQYRYHSKTSRKDFERFLKGEINEIATVKQVKEGANIDGLDGGLIVQLNSKELNITQLLGRFLRGKPGQVIPVIVLVVRNSVDENWVNSALKNFDQSKIFILE